MNKFIKALIELAIELLVALVIMMAVSSHIYVKRGWYSKASMNGNNEVTAIYTTVESNLLTRDVVNFEEREVHWNETLARFLSNESLRNEKNIHVYFR